jgi:DNA-binding PadR family transcriptional regulator
MESNVSALVQRIIRSFLDIIILKYLKNRPSVSGYDIIKHLHRSFHILPSPGTVYAILYSLERQNLVEGNNGQVKRLYKLTEHGEEYLRSVTATRNRTGAFLSCIFSEA